jgi:hypothetical protein
MRLSLLDPSTIKITGTPVFVQNQQNISAFPILREVAESILRLHALGFGAGEHKAV